MMMDEESKRMLKCVLVGDGAVGKTSLIYTFVIGKFPSSYVFNNMARCYDHFEIKLKVDERDVTVCPCDTQGQDDYDRLRPLSYIHADVVMLCFSIAIDKCNSENASYERVESKWKPELKEHAKNVPIILVGLKEDLRHQKNMTAVTVEQGQKLAKKIGAAKYVECSAKHEKGHIMVFEEACRTVYDNDKRKRTKCCTIL